MSYDYRYDQRTDRRRRGWGFTCLVTLVILVFLLLALALGVLYFIKPQVSEQAGVMLGTQVDQIIDQRLDEQFGGLEGQVPPGYADTLIITDAEINDYIAQHPEEIDPLDQASVRFLAGEMQASASAYSLSGTAFAGLAASDGRLVLVSPRIEGSLGLVLDADQLATSLQSSLNSRLAENNLRVTAVTLAEGQLILGVASQ